ncbi:EamA-like transporter family protein [Albidovulum inexpectatum]|uniref:EamA-like transporter family protein n=2 Tax=Albidovulum inexpectatum TaxID=196587 RepID=A0A2S5JG31_9RHOB|nr:EamA-like transporter family protein [Albidovulum inexpectatum]
MQGHAAMLVFSSLVAGSFPLGAMVANAISPSAFTALRFILAAALIGLAVAMGPGLPRAALRAPWRYMVLGGIFASYFILMFEGLKTANPVSAAAVFTLTPIMSAGFGWLLLRQMLTARVAMALALGGVGALWVIFRGDLAAAARLELGRGEAVYMLGCAAHAFYTPLVRRLNRGESPLVFTFGTLLGGSVVTTIYAWGDIRATEWLSLPSIVWVTLAYTTVFASAVTFVLLQFATLRLPSAKVMAYTYLVPGWVLVWQMGLGQPFPGLVVAPGLALTLGALALLLRDDTSVPIAAET